MICKPVKNNKLIAFSLCIMVAVAYAQPSANLGDDIICTAVQPISWRQILPETKTIVGEKTTILNLTACRGEFEPVSFVLTPLKDINDINFIARDLTCGNKVISANHVDIRWVKCWYQAESAWVGIAEGNRQPVLVPELLLKDDKLVRVDYKEKKNYIRLSPPHRQRYICISDPKIVKETQNIPNDRFPVTDSSTLLPTDIKKDQNKQVWVTVQVPAKAVAGVYTGPIDVTVGDTIVGKLTLKVKVLPFELAKPEKEFSLYYHGQLTDGNGSIGTNVKNETQLRAELKNMRDHGVINPMFSMPLEKDRHLLEKYLQIRKELGMAGGNLYYIDGQTFYWDFKNKNVESLKRKTGEVVKLARAYGFTDAYIYGVDEAKVEFVAGQHDTFKAVHDAGGKVFQAGYWGTVDVIGDLMDLQVYAGPMSRDQARKWHAKGKKVYNYGNPQVGVENPWIYRQKYGLALYHYEYDGVMDYAYQHGFGHPWNDFDAIVWRDHIFAYPTTNGVIDTIAWEGFREGVDDVRYLSTLDILLNKTSGEEANRIKQFRKDKIHQIEGEENFDNLRNQIIDKILQLYMQKGGHFIFKNLWSFKKDPENKGLEKGWHEQKFDDSAWEQIPVSTAWEQTAAGEYDGYAWYRTRFKIPPDMQNKKLRLHFSGVDEQAWVYLNGVLIGEHTEKSTGQSSSEIWNEPFSVPLSGIDAKGLNTLSIRVHDSVFAGGILGAVFVTQE